MVAIDVHCCKEVAVKRLVVFDRLVPKVNRWRVDTVNKALEVVLNAPDDLISIRLGIVVVGVGIEGRDDEQFALRQLFSNLPFGKRLIELLESLPGPAKQLVYRLRVRR